MEERIIRVLGEDYRIVPRDNFSVCAEDCAFLHHPCRIGSTAICCLVSLYEPVYLKEIEEDETDKTQDPFTE